MKIKIKSVNFLSCIHAVDFEEQTQQESLEKNVYKRVSFSTADIVRQNR